MAGTGATGLQLYGLPFRPAGLRLGTQSRVDPQPTQSRRRPIKIAVLIAVTWAPGLAEPPVQRNDIARLQRLVYVPHDYASATTDDRRLEISHCVVASE